MNIVHKPTTCFYDETKPNKNEYLKKIFKHSLTYPLIDHESCWAQKPSGQKGKAKVSQTFVVSRPYRGILTENDLDFWIEECKKHDLQMIYEETIFRGGEAWIIIIAETDVDLQLALKFSFTLHNQNDCKITYRTNWDISK